MNAILVTGHTGFIGRRLYHRLVKNGHQVLGLSRSRCDASWAPDKPGPGLSIINDKALGVFFAETKGSIRQIYHLAGAVDFSEKNRVKTMAVNVAGTRYLLNRAAANGVERIVVASSAIVSGMVDNPDDALDEYSTWSDSNAYVESKRMMEILAKASSVNAVIVRIGGCDLRPHVDALRSRKVIFVPPGGTNIIHIDNVVDGLIGAMVHGKPRQTYMLTGENIRFYPLYRQLQDELCSPATLVQIPAGMKKLVGLSKLLPESRFFNRFLLESVFRYKFYLASKPIHNYGFFPKYGLSPIVKEACREDSGKK